MPRAPGRPALAVPARTNPSIRGPGRRRASRRRVGRPLLTAYAAQRPSARPAGYAIRVMLEPCAPAAGRRVSREESDGARSRREAAPPAGPARASRRSARYTGAAGLQQSVAAAGSSSVRCVAAAAVSPCMISRALPAVDGECRDACWQAHLNSHDLRYSSFCVIKSA